MKLKAIDRRGEGRTEEGVWWSIEDDARAIDEERILTRGATTDVRKLSRRRRLPAPYKAPAHLDGSIAGDYGFDPLGLGTNPDRLKYYQEAELVNARWAMMAVAGIVGTEVAGIEPRWWEAGTEDYGFPPAALLAIQFPVMGYLENKRIQGWMATGSSGVNETFPFDPMGMGSKDANMKLKEIKNGRAAMIAFVGIVVQAIVYREGPVAALKDHISNPFGCNMATNIMNIPVNLA